MTLLSGMIHVRRTDPRLGDWLGELADSPLAADPHSDTGHRHSPAEARVRQAGQAAAIAGRRAGPHRVARPARLAGSAGEDDFAAFRAAAGPRRSSSSGSRPKRWATTSPLRSRCSTISSRASRRPTSAGCWPSCATALVPLVAAIAASGRAARRPTCLARHYPAGRAGPFRPRRWPRGIGFDFDRGRLDVTAHPFCTGMGPHDCRITTRYDEQFFPHRLLRHSARSGTRHLRPRAADRSCTACRWAKRVSLGIHESQSRLWENLVGRSRAVLEALFPGGPAGVSRGPGRTSLGRVLFRRSTTCGRRWCASKPTKRPTTCTS